MKSKWSLLVLTLVMASPALFAEDDIWGAQSSDERAAKKESSLRDVVASSEEDVVADDSGAASTDVGDVEDDVD